MNTYDNFKPLSEAEEASLIIDAQAGNERAMERLMGDEGYGPLLAKMARKHMTETFEYDDALQEARLAFLTLVQKHDFDRAASLRTYVSVRLNHEMNDAKTESNGMFDIPVDTKQDYLKIDKESEGDTKAALALAPKHGMTASNFLYVRSMMKAKSLDYQHGGDDGPSDMHDTFNGGPIRSETADEKYAKARVNLLVSQMRSAPVSEDHLRIIDKAYGFDGDLDTGQYELVSPIKSTDSLAAFSDADVAASLSHEDGVTWSRQKVQRHRTAQIKAWRENDEFRAVAADLGRAGTTPTGKDN